MSGVPQGTSMLPVIAEPDPVIYPIRDIGP